MGWNYKSPSDPASVSHKSGSFQNQGNWGATAVSGGAAVAKRESYGGGGSKGMEGKGGSALKPGHKWVLGLGNGV